MNTKSIVFLLLLFPFCKGYGQSADTSFSKILNSVKQYNKAYTQEKVHLHFDKPFYALGDTIWFEGYVVNALNNSPGSRSHVLYVDLIDEADSIRKTLQLPVNVGFAAGDITLSDSLSAGVYHIRAYTNWMRNFSADYFFNKQISIANPFPQQAKAQGSPALKPLSKSAINKPSIVQTGYDIQFFPEGGELVSGLKSSVAFKVIAESGMGADIQGKLIDQSGRDVLTFATAHAGMGSFTFVPEAGKTYAAVIKLPDGSEKRTDLPKARESGYVVTADYSSPDSLTITMLASPDLVNKEDMVLMALSNGGPLFFFKTKFPDKRVNVTAPRNRLPGGILQWTLFNSKNKPVAERLTFNDYRQKVNLSTQNVKTVYQKRGKTELALQATDAAGNPLIGSFSVAVTNADNVQADEISETTILSNLLLTSDLKGYIESPNYYFTEPSAAKNKELDNLLLTQGWRRFVWNDLAQAKLPEICYPAEDALMVSGTVSNSKKAPVAGVAVNLMPTQSGAGGIQAMVTDNEGRFAFKIPDEQATNHFILQAKQKHEDSGITILPDKNIPPTVSPDNRRVASVADTVIKQYSKIAAKQLAASGHSSSMFNKTIHLQEVVIKDYNPKKKLINSHSANLNGPGQADYVLTGKDIETCLDLTCLVAYLPGVSIVGDQRGIKIRLNSIVGTHTPDVLVLVDGQDGIQLNEISPRDIESIEFMKSAAYAGVYGIRGAGGVLLITTKKGSDPNDPVSRQANVVPFKLPIYMAREFYSPKYDNPANANKGLDLRTTVYWNPEIVTDKDGKATVQYYNTDAPGNYRIVIEGISAKGNLCRQVYSYMVE